MTLKYLIFSSEGDALIPGAAPTDTSVTQFQIFRFFFIINTLTHTFYLEPSTSIKADNSITKYF